MLAAAQTATTSEWSSALDRPSAPKDEEARGNSKDY
jgi:hypothetical protein